MKLSLVAISNVKDYLHVVGDTDNTLITAIMAAAKQTVLSYTGLTITQADDYEDLTIAYFIICSELYDTRNYTVQNDKINPAAALILNLHCRTYV
jgi:hypothetical protein